MNDDAKALERFTGRARLFPLSNLVLFPQVVLPLHVFEPRYRVMTAETLAGDRLMAITLLKPGWEEGSPGRPPIHDVACLGRVIAEQSLPDGRYNLLLRGVSRLRIVDEIEDDRPFRTGKCELLADGPLPSIPQAKRLRRKLSDLVLGKFAESGSAGDQLKELFGGELPLGSLCDVLTFALPLPPEQKQALLESLDVVHRAERLMDMLQIVTVVADRRFPPAFSDN